LERFSISELQQFSGVKAHTIRIWEQRYHALKPDRSEGNTRYYDGRQLRRLLNIVSLSKEDYKISELCAMTDKDLFKLLDQQTFHAEPRYEYFVTQIIASALEYDEVQFDKIFSTAILRFGVYTTYNSVLYPVLVRLGLMWSKDALRPSHEHFATSLFRQKLFTVIDSIALPLSTKETWMLFLPANELHETGLLFANYLVRQSRRKVIYLGPDVPFESLKAAALEMKPGCLLTFLVRKNNKEDDEQFLSLLSTEFRDKNIYVACEPSRLQGIKKRKNIVALHSAEELKSIIE
jgi:DNA-binding transcriptional MerR regulator